MLDLSSVRAHLQSVTGVEVVDGEIRTYRVESSGIVSFSCVEHPEFLWTGEQWALVVRHLIDAHGQVEENGLPASDATVGDSVEVGVEPPADEYPH